MPKLFANEINLGWEKNFLQGLSNAFNDIIYSCDQDDSWHFDEIERRHKHLKVVLKF